MHTTIKSLFIICLLTGIPALGIAETHCEPWAAKMESVEGKASVKRDSQSEWQSVVVGDVFCYGDTLRITEFRAALRLENDSLVRLKEGSVIKFIPPKQAFWAELIDGAAHFISRTPKSFTVKAPYMNAAVEGTEFLVTHTATEDTIAVFEGVVVASNDAGSTRLTGMQQSRATAGTAPSKGVTIALRNSANWTLHYPPLYIDDSSLSSDIHNADVGSALSLLGETSYQNDLTAQNLATSLALVTGNTEQARAFNQQALTLDSQSADAQALAILMQLINGQTKTALNSASALTLKQPDSANAWLVHSYTLQAAFKIDSALKAAQQALQLSPKNPLAVIRVAELALSVGKNRLAKNTLKKTVSDRHYKPYADSLQALIALQNNKNRKARKLLTASIAENPNVPLTQFSLGLTLIRLNDLEQGREKIELAVTLDPSNSLYRSYLGKAYATELRGDAAEEQFILAQTLDPEDPTPWFYTALEKQSANDLIGAIESFNKSRALNDGRAVYRSRLLLDQDNAARSADLGRAYNAMGFEHQAQQVATEAVERAPNNHSGHRLLAEIYANDNRHQQVRASERLQATILQPLGAQQLPLGLSETGLLVAEGAGPADLGISEYNSLFTREGLTAQANLLTGSRNTNAYDARIGGMYQSFAMSIGQYHYATDGFRENNDVEYTISNALAQWQISNNISLQAEVSRREEEQGDLGMRFDISDFSDVLRENKTADTYRLSTVIDADQYGQFIVSASAKEKESSLKDQIYFAGNFIYDIEQADDSKANSLLGQYSIAHKSVSFLAGVESSTFENTTLSTELESPGINDEEYLRSYAYLYTDSELLNGKLQTTFGIENIDHNIKFVPGYFGTKNSTTYPKEQSYLPHIGVIWQINDTLTINAGHFKTFSPNPNLTPSITPSHIAGFIQNFDYAKASTTENNALKISAKPFKTLTAGISHVAQTIDLPAPTANLTTIEFDILNYDHPATSAFINYTFNPQLSLSLTALHEKIKRDESITQNFAVPLSLREKSYSAKATYLLNATINISIEGVKTSQKYLTEGAPGIIEGIDSNEDFFIGNAATEIRLPRRTGTFTLSIKNIFDSHFSYADFNSFTQEPGVQKLIPERSIYGSITLYY